MRILKKIDQGIARMMELLMGASIFLMTLILALNVIYRLFFSKSIVFAEEIGRYCIVMVTFVGLSYIARQDKHVKVSLLFDVLPARGKKIMSIVIDLTMCALLLFISFHAYGYMMLTLTSGRVSPALSIPVSYVSAAVFLGFVLFALEYLVELVMNLSDPCKMYLGRKEYHIEKYKEDILK